MNRPPRCIRRLFTFTQQADEDLLIVARRYAMSRSEVIRLALRLAAERLAEQAAPQQPAQDEPEAVG